MLGTVALFLALQEKPFTPTTLPDLRREARSAEASEALAGRVRRWFGTGIATGAQVRMAAALAFKKYDDRFDFANGNHSDRYQRAHFPSILRWVWR